MGARVGWRVRVEWSAHRQPRDVDQRRGNGVGQAARQELGLEVRCEDAQRQDEQTHGAGRGVDGARRRVALDCGDEAVPALRDGLDRVGELRVQGLADGGDLHRQVGLLDERPGPQRGEQLALLEQRAVVPHQQVQQVEGLGAQGYPRPVAGQDVLAGTEFEGPEPVRGRWHLDFVWILFARS
jgi:hypothetical protein